MKTFLKLTALFEALTGLGLIAIPKLIVLLLFQATLNDAGGIIVAMIAGVALISLATICWFSRENKTAYVLVKVMLFYNIAVIAIALFGILNYELKGAGLWLVVCFHSVLAIWASSIIKKRGNQF